MRAKSASTPFHLDLPALRERGSIVPVDGHLVVGDEECERRWTAAVDRPGIYARDVATA